MGPGCMAFLLMTTFLQLCSGYIVRTLLDIRLIVDLRYKLTALYYANFCPSSYLISAKSLVYYQKQLFFKGQIGLFNDMTKRPPVFLVIQFLPLIQLLRKITLHPKGQLKDRKKLHNNFLLLVFVVWSYVTGTNIQSKDSCTCSNAMAQWLKRKKNFGNTDSQVSWAQCRQ